MNLRTIFPPRRLRTGLRALTLLGALSCAQAHAQFLDMLKGAVTNAATNAVTNAASSAASSAASNAVNGVVNGAVNGTRQAAGAPRSQPAQPVQTAASAQGSAAPAPSAALLEHCVSEEKDPLPPLGPRPADFEPASVWPDPPACIAHEFANYRFTAAEREVKAFFKAGQPLCPECNNGRANDGLASRYIDDGKMHGDMYKNALLALRPGEHLDWKGKRYTGTIVPTGEHPIGAFPCRQFRLSLFDKDKKVVAERPAMYCQYRWRGGELAWHETF